MRPAPGDPVDDAEATVAYLLDLASHSPHRGRLDEAPIHGRGDNVVCGDTVELWASTKADGRLADVRFVADGCAMSQAAAALVCADARERRPVELLGLGADDVSRLLGFRVGVARVKCAVLALRTLQDALRVPPAARPALRGVERRVGA